MRIPTSLLVTINVFCFSLLCVQASSIVAAQQNPLPDGTAEIAQRRLAHFRHGLNLTNWFAQSDLKDYTKEHFAIRITAQDVALIHAMGFDHVRLSIDPRPMLRPKQADQIPVDYLGYLDSAVKMLLDHDLAVELAIFPDEDFKQKLATDDDFVEQFADFWRAFARHFSAFDPDRVFFEILNEPEGKDSYRWYGIETKLANAIREGAPEHTIIATGARYSDDDELLLMEPLRDPNVVYTFHFYSPFLFTHQGANWAVNYWHYLHDVPYPSDPDNARKIEEEVPDAVNRLQIVRYGLDRWNAARIDGEIAQVADWAKHWNVPVICNEFGAYRGYANPNDRAAWLSDVRIALEKYGIGWTMWNYDIGFGVVTKDNGVTTPDPITIHALGMEVPPPSQ